MVSSPTWLSTETPDAIESLLRQRGLIAEDQGVASVALAGDGNMNVTLRVVFSDTEKRSTLIVKQSRPFVAKYDFIPAPIERATYEAKFYKFIKTKHELAACMPQLLDWIPEQYVIVMQDLGDLSDASQLYSVSKAEASETLQQLLPPLIGWLDMLHIDSTGLSAEDFSNTQLRKLNHAHIFTIPFQSTPAIDLDAVTPGLADASQSIRTDSTLVRRIEQLGEVYLATGNCLLHGDFYPGSWLLTDEGAKVIDPEFSFAGRPEFDWSVLVAHLRLCGFDQTCEQVRRSLPAARKIDWSLVQALAGVEILRRLLGVAQLPLSLTLDEKLALIQQASHDILSPSVAETNSAHRV